MLECFSDPLFTFCVGWAVGGAAIYGWFRGAKLIRSRYEWHRATGRCVVCGTQLVGGTTCPSEPCSEFSPSRRG